jgi:hypothetical protein
MLPYGRWNRSARVRFCRRARSISIDDSTGALRTGGGTHITSKVLLLAQDGLISIELAFKLAEQILHTILIRYSPPVALEYLLKGKSRRDRIEIRIFDAGRLLEFGTGLGLSRDQLWAGADAREVACNSARLVQLESVILLNYKERKKSV